MEGPGLEVLLVEPSSPPVLDSRPPCSQICCVARHAERADAAYSLFRGAPYVQSEEYALWPFDPPLSDDGERGALESAAELKRFVSRHDTTIHVVISSPYLRCAQTAAVICRELGPETILMFDDSCGEIFGPGIFGNDQPERTHRDFTTVVEECKARGVTRIAPVCVGTRPHWPENIPDGRQRFNESFLSYVHRGTDKVKNMLVVTHADLVAAAATLLPGNRDISHVQPGALLMASRIRPMGPGDAWSVVSSERSDEQSESKVVKFLSRAQGWKVESFHIEFCPTHRTRENVVKRMVASLRKFTAKSKLGEDKVRYLLKAFSGDRRRRKRSLCISPPPGGPLGPDPAYWVFSCEAGDPLDRMPPQVSRAWCGTSPRSSPRSSPRASPRFPPKLPVPGQAPASSSATRLMGMSDEKPKTLRALVSMTNFSTSAGSLVHSSGAQSSGAQSSESLSVSECSERPTKREEKKKGSPPSSSGSEKGKKKAFLTLPTAGSSRGAINDISSSPLWKRRQQKPTPPSDRDERLGCLLLPPACPGPAAPDRFGEVSLPNSLPEPFAA